VDKEDEMKFNMHYELGRGMTRGIYMVTVMGDWIKFLKFAV